LSSGGSNNNVYRGRSDDDIKIEGYNTYFTELENTLGEMQEHAREMSVSENDQADTTLDLSNNIRELGIVT
jgi:acyl-CoA synthetase (AMP-forming)/AMP-acid ligase II